MPVQQTSTHANHQPCPAHKTSDEPSVTQTHEPQNGSADKETLQQQHIISSSPRQATDSMSPQATPDPSTPQPYTIIAHHPMSDPHTANSPPPPAGAYGPPRTLIYPFDRTPFFAQRNLDYEASLKRNIIENAHAVWTLVNPEVMLTCHGPSQHCAHLISHDDTPEKSTSYKVITGATGCWHFQGALEVLAEHMQGFINGHVGALSSDGKVKDQVIMKIDLRGVQGS